MDYQSTSLWKRTLGLDNENVKPLRDSFLGAHENAEFLLAKIRKDFPNLTVHDISHVDSLWNVADTIIGEDYLINPLEGYVLGISFLIHDAALSYETVGGIDELRNTVEWKDAYADGANGKDEEIFKKECDFTAIRALHAREAEIILSKIFTKDNGTTFYIIDNDSLRRHYGELIGKIAASHHWDIDDVSSLELQINPRREYPNEWKINAQKLACILRCADAGHIDNGRAPDNIYNILSVNGVSKQHWDSQNHLCQVCEDEKDKSMLCITSSDSFTKEEFAAWNVAYEAVKVFDNEIKASNNLLKEQNLDFPHKGVSGAGSKEALAKYIKTKEWIPCSFNVHTSNVKSLIENLGGSKLYGEDYQLLTVLRELIQNARDAIAAKRCMEEIFTEGHIWVHLIDDNTIEVLDDGIGMSKRCIKNYLLDFGSSYWKSGLMLEENKGLKSRGFCPIGKYGIGFYSIFMVAKSVEVITCRGKEETVKIEFPEGLTLSPIMSKCQNESSVSTRIRFKLKEDVSLKFKARVRGASGEISISLKKAIQIIVSGLDTNIYFKNMSEDTELIHMDISSRDFDVKEWLKGLIPSEIKEKYHYKDKVPELINISPKMDILKDRDGRIRGIVAIPEDYMFNNSYPAYPSIETVCGLTGTLKNIFKGNFIGFIDFKEDSISRNSHIIDDGLKVCLQDWIISKYNSKFEEIKKSEILQSIYCHLLYFCQVDIDKLEDENKQALYKTYRISEIEVGTIKGLKFIHLSLFAGLYNFAGKFRIDDVAFVNEKNGNVIDNPPSFSNLDESLRAIEKMPEDSYVEIISKYIAVLRCHPFFDGNKRCAAIWVNYMLRRKFGKMIDWSSINHKEFNEAFYEFIANNDEEPLCSLLWGYMTTNHVYYVTRL